MFAVLEKSGIADPLDGFDCQGRSNSRGYRSAHPLNQRSQKSSLDQPETDDEHLQADDASYIRR